MNGDWNDLDIDNRTHTLLPPYSPDMHCVIEASHALVVGYMQKYIDACSGMQGDSLPTYISELQRLFYEKITPAWAQNTTHRLFTRVLPAILERDEDYPPKRLR